MRFPRVSRPGRRASSAELLGQQREREEPPREIDVAREEERSLARRRELPHAQHERVDRPRELLSPLAV